MTGCATLNATIKCDKGERQVQRSAQAVEQTQLTANCLVTELGLVVIIVWRVVVVINLVICLFVVVTACGMQWIEQHTQSLSPIMRCNCQVISRDQQGLPQPKTILERYVSERKRNRRLIC